MIRQALVLAFVGSTVGLSAQAPDANARFEVASIKPANPAVLHASSGSEGADWRATNFTAFMLVQRAYPEYGDPDRIVGWPSWMREAKFDVQAKAAELPTQTSLNAMLRNLLAERFALQAHVEPRPLDVYVVRLTRADGRPGPWLVPTPPDCVRQNLAGRPMPDGCDRIVKARAAATSGRALTLLSLTMPTLLGVFREVGGLDRPIVDRTGLGGFYDVSVQYQSADPLNVSNTGTTLVAAAEDQLGLKFERSRENIEVLVIDSIQRPSPD
jgi:uncharacterized protein (TIGR03435 family)